MNKKVEEALNQQINEELYSAYLYFSMASHFASVNLNGFSRWMEAQAAEELSHAMKIYHYINERGGRAMLTSIKAPKAEWKSPREAFENALKHEQYITGCIHKLVALSREQADYASEIMLQWFVTEQVEEEATAEDVVEKLKMIGDQKHLLLMLDRELGSRGATGS